MLRDVAGVTGAALDRMGLTALPDNSVLPDRSEPCLTIRRGAAEAPPLPDIREVLPAPPERVSAGRVGAWRLAVPGLTATPDVWASGAAHGISPQLKPQFEHRHSW